MGTWIFYLRPVKDEDKTGSNLYSVYMDVYIVNIEIDFDALKEKPLETQQFLYIFWCTNMCISWETTINSKNVITFESDSCTKL